MKQGLLFLFAGSFFLNLFLGYNLWQSSKERRQDDKNKEFDTGSSYPFLSKRIFVDDPNDIFVNFQPLRTALNDYSEKVGKNLKVYFEYLPSGNSIGVNEKDELKMASLVKVPTVMGIYKKVEKGEHNLSENLTIKKSQIDKSFGSLWEEGEGAKIIIKDAIWKTLVESDNTAHNVLYDILSEHEKQTLYSNFDITLVEGSSTPLITAKGYSSILKALYLSSFLPKEYSNEILEILTYSKFEEGITKNIPSGIKAAHKLGEYEKGTPGIYVYSDCGIVYVPKRQYILCVMFEGTREQAHEHMQLVGRMVFEYISKINLKVSD